MTRHGFCFAVFATLLAGCGAHLQPQMQPERFISSEAVTTASSTVTTVPFFQSSFSFDGSHIFRMVGKSPTLKTTTTIPTEIVPVKLIFSDGTTFDPSTVVAGLRASPIFTTAAFNAAGTTQYGDAQMRSEFWSIVKGSNYHVLLGVPHVFATVTERVPSTDGATITVSGSKQGRVQFSWLIATIEPQLIKSLGIQPTTLAFFVTSNTRVLETAGSSATFGGYHDSFHLPVSTGTGIFGTIWGAMFSSTPRDVTHVGHETVEWLNDPFYPVKSTTSPFTTNPVYHWINPETNTCNTQGQLEVADPVTTKHNFTINGYTFEDAVLLSWFSHSASSAIDGDFDLRASLKGPATPC